MKKFLKIIIFVFKTFQVKESDSNRDELFDLEAKLETKDFNFEIKITKKK